MSTVVAPQILRANLAMLARHDPALASRLAEMTPANLEWSESKAGKLTAALVTPDGKRLQLASKYDPLAEAKQLLSAVDYPKHATIVMMGVGIGYHILEVAPKLTAFHVLVVYEPDEAVLRAVMERVDHTPWLKRTHLILLTGSDLDRGMLVGKFERFSSLVTQGTVLVVHPPTRQLHAAAINEFGKLVTDAAAYCRTNVATALVNSARTISNLMKNMPYYVAGSTTNELHLAAKGFPAVCVGAGPSLQKNVQLLADPAVRKNVVVVSAQTTLKPLLDRGVRPDFVTALDYSEISRRFYDGLPELPGVTLIAEPKAHPTILDSFPGAVRVTQNVFLDNLLGELARPIHPIPAGATVAHLSVYVAQHLGCNPIMLIGQDLGFSDGLYYCPGTAIHEVWASELNSFNTLEMMEWQRIVRHRNHLAKVKDVHGREIYSDEQMLTYLKQFERDFAQAKEQIIDATEGGQPKAHTTRMTFAEALQRYATRPVPVLPAPDKQLDLVRLRAVIELVQRRIREITDIVDLTRRSIPILKQMQEHENDPVMMDKLFERLDKNRDKVHGYEESFGAVNQLNTMGAFKRSRADRAIESAMLQTSDVKEKQRQQIKRDMENLEWLAPSCDEALTIFETSLERLSRSLGAAGARGRKGGG